jgi:hypothetical protein
MISFALILLAQLQLSASYGSSPTILMATTANSVVTNEISTCYNFCKPHFTVERRVCIAHVGDSVKYSSKDWVCSANDEENLYEMDTKFVPNSNSMQHAKMLNSFSDDKNNKHIQNHSDQVDLLDMPSIQLFGGMIALSYMLCKKVSLITN